MVVIDRLSHLCYNESKKGGGFIKSFCFTVDDNIRFLKEITENRYDSIFDHPYLSMYRRLHKEFGLKIQLNLFYRTEGFELSEMSDRYRSEWEENADWLKLSFHSDMENLRPYESSDYSEVYADCRRTHEQIRRFASPESLARTTTIHYCLLTSGGLEAMADNGVSGLLGLFGTNELPRTSYGIGESEAQRIREGETVSIGDFSFAAIDIILNKTPIGEITKELERLGARDTIRVMIHEQYFYEDYVKYQPEFEEKLKTAFAFFLGRGYQSRFYEDLIDEREGKNEKAQRDTFQKQK